MRRQIHFMFSSMCTEEKSTTSRNMHTKLNDKIKKPKTKQKINKYALKAKILYIDF